MKMLLLFTTLCLVGCADDYPYISNAEFEQSIHAINYSGQQSTADYIAGLAERCNHRTDRAACDAFRQAVALNLRK